MDPAAQDPRGSWKVSVAFQALRLRASTLITESDPFSTGGRTYRVISIHISP